MSPRRHNCAVAPVVLLALAVSMAACGPGAREKALSTSLAGLNAARQVLVTYDAEKQQKIVADATSLEDGTAKLAAHRDRRAPLIEAFAVAYATLAAAALDIDSPTRWLDALQAAQGVYEAVKVLVSDNAGGK